MQRLEGAVKDLKLQLGRTGSLAEDLKEQVELLALSRSRGALSPAGPQRSVGAAPAA